MKIKNKGIILSIIAVILIIVGLVVYFNSSSEPEDDGKTDHRDEFEIVESNYLERYYKRYKAYRKTHRNLSDDTIITYVNIGLDKKDYVDVEKTNIDDGILMIVNKHYTISEDYVPKTKEYGGMKAKLEESMVKDFDAMVKAGKKNEPPSELFATRAYTTISEQNAIYDMSVIDNGEEVTLKTVPKPGYSEYQTGLDVNISGVSINFEQTREFKFLAAHAHEYGFILRYPKGKEKITGFEYEPYHWRYVGKEAAKIIHDKDITFEEYYATYVLK